MMDMLEKNITSNVALASSVNQQVANNTTFIPPVTLIPQAPALHATPEGRNGVNQLDLQPIIQNVASALGTVTTAQLEMIINEKIKAVIASEQAEKLVSKGRPYPAK
ncbi:hypothetical protein, partial [Chromobacterium amazonense]|uniref:hypothetical protein n=1 Tax=Chromobacterium amazonense TaxID=1382803 RepID=UPI0031F70F4D